MKKPLIHTDAVGTTGGKATVSTVQPNYGCTCRTSAWTCPMHASAGMPPTSPASSPETAEGRLRVWLTANGAEPYGDDGSTLPTMEDDIREVLEDLLDAARAREKAQQIRTDHYHDLCFTLEPEVTRLTAALAAREREIEGLKVALRKLAAEVSGLQAFITREAGDVRDVIGQTNWNVLMLRWREAREALTPERTREEE